MTRLSNKKGITLIELLVSLALFGIVISVIFSLQLFAMKTFAKGEMQSEVQTNIRFAADYITTQLRNAYKLEILSSLPIEIDPQKRYFYVEDNKIKHYYSGMVKDVLGGSAADYIPNLIFDKDTDGTSINKVLSYTIYGIYKSQDFSITSEVYPANMGSDDIVGDSGGAVLAYSSPLTDQETVDVDKVLLDLWDYNLMLKEELDGSLTLNPPTPNVLMLILLGKNGSLISWSSSQQDVVTHDGTVFRPGVGEDDKTVQLIATLAKGEASASKTFEVNIKAFEPLILLDTTIPTARIGNSYRHVFSSSGGNGIYIYSMEPETGGYNLSTHGLVLHENGILEGEVTSPHGSYKYVVTVTDGTNSYLTEFNFVVNTGTDE